MADISSDPYAWSTTAGSNSPSGSTAVGTGLDDNLRAIQAAVKSAILALTSVAGTNTITATAGNVAAYATGQYFVFVPAATNTAAATLNVNSLGAKSIFNGGVALIGGELRAGWAYLVEYDGTQFNLIGNPPAYATGAIADNSTISLFAPLASTGVYLVAVGASDNNVYAHAIVSNAGGAALRVVTLANAYFSFSSTGTRQLQLVCTAAGVGQTYYAGAIRLG